MWSSGVEINLQQGYIGVFIVRPPTVAGCHIESNGCAGTKFAEDRLIWSDPTNGAKLSLNGRREICEIRIAANCHYFPVIAIYVCCVRVYKRCERRRRPGDLADVKTRLSWQNFILLRHKEALKSSHGCRFAF